jgi:hypothetical protein
MRLAISVCCVVLFCCPATVASRVTQPRPAAQALFDFHSGFWINLHHFLYLQALAQKPQPGPRPPVVSKADAEILSSLSQEERSAWSAAVAYYQESLIERDLLFDEGMRAIKNQLEDAEASPDLGHAEIPDALKAKLLKAAPVYRKYWWGAHNAENQEWMAKIKPLVYAHGYALRDALVRIYETPWPGDPVRVDVTVYGGRVGAYTTVEPTRPTISSTDPTNQGTAALEILFHETSHGMMSKVIAAFREAESSANSPGSSGPSRPSTLWHAVLFYTAGELVAQQIPGYVPYADKNGLWARAWPDPERALIERDWRPHMNGSVSLPAAITKLVSDIATTAHP